MPIGGIQAQVCFGVGRLCGAFVVADDVGGQDQDCQRQHGQAAGEHGAGPTDHVGGDAPPAPHGPVPAWFVESEAAADGQ
ncbi:Uncharacterised protein [Mycobacteroides abscessus subsp. abscessus]|nr:Uncharacterised protein [Mycobacteroides abscessus subsp. abscessus]SKV84269.1 Uncharacterised protein [Mycobacteroides abscessus subsp. abscessus]